MKDKPQGYAHLTAEIDSLQEQLRLCNVDQFSTAAELAAAQADAKRYRWLRDDKRGRSLSVSSLEWTGNAKLSDAAVDAAMQGRADGFPVYLRAWPWPKA